VSGKPVIPRPKAFLDVEGAVNYYLAEANEKTALGFIDALERAYRLIASHPASGSPPYAHALDLPGLRCWSSTRYPFLIFHVERDDHVDVWRVLHGERDIPAWLRKMD
jgi:toxin ParE1/3/4